MCCHCSCPKFSEHEHQLHFTPKMHVTLRETQHRTRVPLAGPLGLALFLWPPATLCRGEGLWFLGVQSSRSPKSFVGTGQVSGVQADRRGCDGCGLGPMHTAPGIGSLCVLKAHKTHFVPGQSGCHVPSLVTLHLALTVPVWRRW